MFKAVADAVTLANKDQLPRTISMSVSKRNEFLDKSIPNRISLTDTFGDTAMVEAPINRIKQHLREATPTTPRERGEN